MVTGYPSLGHVGSDFQDTTTLHVPPGSSVTVRAVSILSPTLGNYSSSWSLHQSGTCGTLRLDPHRERKDEDPLDPQIVAPRSRTLMPSKSRASIQHGMQSSRASKLPAFRSGKCLLKLRELTPAAWRKGYNHPDTEGPSSRLWTDTAGGWVYSPSCPGSLILSLKPWRPHWRGGAPCEKGLCGVGGSWHQK